jgi:3-hydroxy acid dehydrogenase/malonic semialdehyde reductase
MRDLKAVERMPHELPADFKDVDILINNAGLALGVSSVTDHDIEARPLPTTNVQGLSWSFLSTC